MVFTYSYSCCSPTSVLVLRVVRFKSHQSWFSLRNCFIGVGTPPIQTLRLTCSTGRYILHLAPSKWNCFLCLCAYMFSFQWHSWYFSFILSSAPMVMLMVHWSWVLGWNRLAYLYNCLVRVFFILYTLHQVHGNVLVDLGHPKWICLNKMTSICMLFMQ